MASQAAAAPPTSSKSFISLRIKVVVAFTLLFTIVFTGAFYWFYEFTSTVAEERIQANLQRTLEGLQERFTPEVVDEMVALVQEGEPDAEGFSDDPRYRSIMAMFHDVRQIEPEAFPYTWLYANNPDDPYEVIYVVDVWAGFVNEADKARAGRFQERYSPEADGYIILDALQGYTPYYDIYPDEWGTWVSAYVPLIDSTGQAVGILGMDFRAEYVEGVQLNIRRVAIPAFLTGFVVLFALVYFASGALTAPIINLTEAAAEVGRGNYEQDFTQFGSSGPADDEITTLANVFEQMVAKVRTREEKLKQQVAELQIIIDEGKRSKQVSEIVETEFFQELQEKARTMRHRKEITPEEEGKEA